MVAARWPRQWPCQRQRNWRLVYCSHEGCWPLLEHLWRWGTVGGEWWLGMLQGDGVARWVGQRWLRMFCDLNRAWHGKQQPRGWKVGKQRMWMWNWTVRRQEARDRRQRHQLARLSDHIWPSPASGREDPPPVFRQGDAFLCQRVGTPNSESPSQGNELGTAVRSLGPLWLRFLPVALGPISSELLSSRRKSISA